MNDLIAEQCFDLKQVGKEDAVVQAGLTAPRFDSESNSWQCTVRVHLPEVTIIRLAQGSEPLHAIVSACKLLHVEMQALMGRFGDNIMIYDTPQLDMALGWALARV